MANFTLNSLVLLAGHSQRMGRLKQHVMLNGATFLQHITGKLRLQQQYLHQMFFVGQAGDLEGQRLVSEFSGIWVNNPHPEDGPLSSIRLAAGKMPDGSAILLWPVDHPMIAPETVNAIIERWLQSPDMITVPSDGQRRGHPAIFPGWCQQLFFAIDLNEGARKIMQLHPERINHVVTDDIWITRNLNTPELLADAEKWLKDRVAKVR